MCILMTNIFTDPMKFVFSYLPGGVTREGFTEHVHLNCFESWGFDEQSSFYVPYCFREQRTYLGNKHGPSSLEGKVALRLRRALKKTLKLSDFSVEALGSHLRFATGN